MVTLHVPDSRRARRSKPSAATCGASGAGRGRWRSTREDRRATLRRDRSPRPGRGGRASAARAHLRRAAHPLERRARDTTPPACCSAISSERHRRRGAAPRRRHPAGKRLLIVADYDADGATACAVGMRALRAFGAHVGLPRARPLQARLRPHARAGRARRAAQARPAHHRRQRHRQRRRRGARAPLGIATLITDHHLPGRRAAARRRASSIRTSPAAAFRPRPSPASA